MGFIKKIELPDNNIYDIKNTIIPVVGTQSAATGNWTGNIDIDSLYDGLTIAYFLPYAGSGNATLNLTLKDGTETGAINCYYDSGRLTTHYTQGSNIIMTYWSAGSISIDGVDTTDDRWVAQGNYADGDNKTQQTINNNNKNYPLLFSYAERSNTTTNVTNAVYRNNDFFINPSNGFIYSKKGFCAGPFKTAAEGKCVWISQDGINANNYLDGYSVAAYQRQIIQAYAGKCTSANGLLLKIDSGGLTIVGGGESGANLAGLIADDQTIENPNRLDINNSAGASDKETTAFVGGDEQLVLSSDYNIYFATGCNTIANRVAVCLNKSRTFYPMTDNTGSIGSNSYKWQYGYFGQVYGTGSSYSWKTARDNASFINSTPPARNHYTPAIDLKTTNGDWSIGSVGNQESLIFSYVADSIYSGSTNKSRRYILEASDTPDDNSYNILHTGNTSFTQTLSSGTKIGTVKINGTSTDLYCETNENTTYTLSRSNKDIVLTPSSGTTTSAAAANLQELTHEDLDNVIIPGFYNAGGGNSCTNTPNSDSTSGFGLIVLQTGSGAWYYQFFNYCGQATTYKRVRNGNTGVWTDWAVTDTNTAQATGTADVIDYQSFSFNKGTLPSLSTKSTTIYPVTSSTTTATKTTLGTAIAADDITSWSAGTLPELGEDIAVNNITSWSAGTLPTISTTNISADDITSWNAGTLPTFTVSKGILTLNSGTLPSLSYTARSIPNVTSAGALPSLTYSSVSIPNISSVGTLPSLSYTARSIPNVTGNTNVTVPILSSSVTISEVSTWSAGTLPSLTYSSVNVVTGVST